MKTIKLSLEYGCSPVWVYEDDCLVGTGLPSDLADVADLERLLLEMQTIFESGFFNTPTTFEDTPFSPEEKEALGVRLDRVLAILGEHAKDYRIVNHIQL